MKRATIVVVAIALLGYAAACAALFAWQRSLLYFPQPRAVVAAGSSMRLPVDGAELVVTVREHDGPKAIVYFGGNAEDVSRSLASYGDAFPDHALYFLHYRGYGGSTGEPTERHNVDDALALVERVRARHPDIRLVGRSLGSGVAVQVASRVPVARLVLVTPFDSIVGIAAQLYPFMPVRWLMRDRYESGLVAAGIRIPTTIVVAANDTVIPRASSETLFGRFPPGVATWVVLAGVGHNDIERAGYLAAVQAALR